METRIEEYMKNDRKWYKAQRKFLGFWIDLFGRNGNPFVFTSYSSTKKQSVINFIIKARG